MGASPDGLVVLWNSLQFSSHLAPLKTCRGAWSCLSFKSIAASTFSHTLFRLCPTYLQEILSLHTAHQNSLQDFQELMMVGPHSRPIKSESSKYLGVSCVRPVGGWGNDREVSWLQSIRMYDKGQNLQCGPNSVQFLSQEHPATQGQNFGKNLGASWFQDEG